MVYGVLALIGLLFTACKAHSGGQKSAVAAVDRSSNDSAAEDEKFRAKSLEDARASVIAGSQEETEFVKVSQQSENPNRFYIESCQVGPFNDFVEVYVLNNAQDLLETIVFRREAGALDCKRDHLSYAHPVSFKAGAGGCTTGELPACHIYSIDVMLLGAPPQVPAAKTNIYMPIIVK